MLKLIEDGPEFTVCDLEYFNSIYFQLRCV